MASHNRVTLIGNLGQNPEVRAFQSGDKVCNLSIATTETWKDKSGERKERTQWHRVVIFNQGLVTVAEKYLTKGSKVFLAGQLETRKYKDKDGTEKYATEVVLRPFRGELVLLDAKRTAAGDEAHDDTAEAEAAAVYAHEEPIPF